MACAVSRPQAFFDVSAVTPWADVELNASRHGAMAPAGWRLEVFAPWPGDQDAVLSYGESDESASPTKSRPPRLSGGKWHRKA